MSAPVEVPEGMRWCTRGQHLAPMTAFSSSVRRCRPCDALYARERRAAGTNGPRAMSTATRARFAPMVADFLRACAIGGGDGNAPASVGVTP